MLSEYTLIKSITERRKIPTARRDFYLAMHLSNFNELKQKEVINVCDGRRLGFVCNVEFEVPSGQIVSLSVPADCKCFTFGKIEEIRIPWCNIERIGEDIIIVKADFIGPPKKHENKCC